MKQNAVNVSTKRGSNRRTGKSVCLLTCTVTPKRLDWNLLRHTQFYLTILYFAALLVTFAIKISIWPDLAFPTPSHNFRCSFLSQQYKISHELTISSHW